MRRRGSLVLTLAVACSASDAPIGGATPGRTSGAEDTATSVGAGSTSTGAEGDAAGTTEAEEDATTSAADTTSSTAATGANETGCTPGAMGCPCDEGVCAAGLACLEELCTAPQACEEDLLEPNDEESAPTLLGELDDDDEGNSIFGTLDGPDDVDWYRYGGNDTLLGNVEPARFVKSDGGMRLCKFAECLGGVELTQFDCPAETEAATSPLGRPGCCAPMGIALADANCTDGFDDDMQVFLRVDQAQAQCVAYELVYSF